MARTLGWVQDATDISKLKNIVQIFVPDSVLNKMLREEIVPNFRQEIDKSTMIEQLSAQYINIDFTLLVGKGPLKGETRATASCSGIAQAVLPAQNGRSYQSDWSTKSFVLWAIAIGLLNYDSKTDKCSLSSLGDKFAKSSESEERNILVEAHLSYPPVCRILNILNEAPNESFTKFEIGKRFGFNGEDGFTSYSTRFILDGLRQLPSNTERKKFLSNTEGTSDKYVRTICSWLKKLGLIEQTTKELTEVFDNKSFSYTMSAYKLKIGGQQAITSNGKSKHPKKPKIVYYEMLATKATDASYLRQRRALLIKFLTKGYKTIESCVNHLYDNGINNDKYAVLDDITGLENIGLTVAKKNSGEYKITDSIEHLQLPQKEAIITKKTNIEQIKDSLRPYLKTISHKYLALIDFSFGNGNKGVSKEFELLTADLLTTELKFKGGRLGDSRKPDVCVYYEGKGLIIDNKAYKSGYSLPISQADEMVRYLQENKQRSIKQNSNQWWLVFSPTVKEFNFAFISGDFVGKYKNQLCNISMRTGVNGAAIDSQNLIYWAELIKSGSITYTQALNYFNCNNRIDLCNQQNLYNTTKSQQTKSK